MRNHHNHFYLEEDIELPAPQGRRGPLRSSNWFSDDSVFVKGASTYGYSKLTANQRKHYEALDSKVRTFLNASDDLDQTNGSYYVATIDIKDGELGEISQQEAFEVLYAYDSATGKLTIKPVKKGKATITVKAGKKTAKITVKVN